ncbi:MAG: Rrf2 family transcriptional regulator [Chromatocurvus sp.]
MRLTQHTDYALRVLIFLAVSKQDRVRIRDIALAYNISHHHLTKVVQQLQHRGFVTTVRGKGGGITLARSAALINIGDLVRQIESAEYLVECFSPNNQCVITGACELPSIFNDAVEAFTAVLDKYTLEEIVCGRLPALQQALKL